MTKLLVILSLFYSVNASAIECPRAFNLVIEQLRRAPNLPRTDYEILRLLGDNGVLELSDLRLARGSSQRFIYNENSYIVAAQIGERTQHIQITPTENGEGLLEVNGRIYRGPIKTREELVPNRVRVLHTYRENIRREVTTQYHAQKILSIRKADEVNVKAAFSPNNKFIALSTEEKGLKLIRLSDGEVFARILEDEAIKKVAIAPDNRSIIVITADRKIWLYTVDGGRLMHMNSLSETTSPHLVKISFSPRYHVVAIADDKALSIFGLQNGAGLFIDRNFNERATALAFNQQGNKLAYVDGITRFKIVELFHGEPRVITIANQFGAPRLSFSEDGSRIFCMHLDESLRAIDTATGREIFRRPYEIYRPDIVVRGDTLMLRSRGNIYHIDARTGLQLSYNSLEVSGPYPGLSPNGRYLFSYMGSSEIRAIDTETGNIFYSIRYDDALGASVNYSYDGHLIANAPYSATQIDIHRALPVYQIND